MSGLPWTLQGLVWVYALVAAGGLLGCVWVVLAGWPQPRHRAPRPSVAAWLRRAAADISRGFVDGVEWLVYG